MLPGRHSDRHRTSAATLTAIGTCLVVVVVVVGFVVWLARTPAYRRLRRYLWRRRQRASRAMYQQRTIGDEDKPIAEEIIGAARSTQPWIEVLWAILPIAFIVDGLGHPELRPGFFVLAAGYVLVIIPVQVWRRRRVIDRRTN